MKKIVYMVVLPPVTVTNSLGLSLISVTYSRAVALLRVAVVS